MKRGVRSKKIWKLKYRLYLFDAALAVAIIFNVCVFYLLKMLMERLGGQDPTTMTLMGIMMGAVGLITVFIFIVIITLHRSLGPIIQVERVLDEVNAGNYGLRVHFRKNDILHELEDKLNRVLDLLELKAKNEDSGKK